MSIEVLNVTKRYGAQKALDGVSFIIDRPQVVALLGPNGAGKSTLMKIITTYILPDSGEVRVNGRSVYDDPMGIRRSIGYLPEHNPLYLYMYVFEYLEFVGGFFGVSKKRIIEAAEMTGLLPEAHKRLEQLSKGYRQRAGLAAAILHDPPVLILDEPTTGLDPAQVVEIRNLIKSLSRNKIILLSTHIMQEVQRVAERVLLLHKGKLILDRPVEAMQAGQTVVVEFDTRIEPEFLRRLPGLKELRHLGGMVWEMDFEGNDDVRSIIFDFAVREGLKILKLDHVKTDWENVFISQTGTGENRITPAS
ncbi:MAG: ATP-binding cassette domain-containing protein [Chlorobi bacterium]|nr:ATP-binding cassette domain-containing protein [Chlorobiota bacterium]